MGSGEDTEMAVAVWTASEAEQHVLIAQSPKDVASSYQVLAAIKSTGEKTRNASVSTRKSSHCGENQATREGGGKGTARKVQ